MSTKVWADFLDLLMPYGSGWDIALAKQYVKEATIEFCEQTLAYRHRIDPITTAADVSEYDWPVPPTTVLVQPIELWYRETTRLEATSPGELAALYGDWQAAKGEPSYYLNDTTSGNTRQLSLVPTPQASVPNAITGVIAVKPTLAATYVDTIIYEDFGMKIAKGALARLFAIPKRPWSDPAMAAQCQAEFDAACGRAQMRAAKGFSRAPLRTRTHDRVS